MQEKKGAVNQFAETLRAAAAAAGQPVGQQSVALDLDSDTRSAGMDTDREARIAELRRQYLEGSYSMDPREIAARIVDDHLS
jgi:anti-sigma28 factor (negative regulator of flagellin synthesis)